MKKLELINYFGLLLVFQIVSCTSSPQTAIPENNIHGSKSSRNTITEKPSTEQQTIKSTKDVNVQFKPYDSPPTPIGGFEAIQKNIVYPDLDKGAKKEGTVVVQAHIDENGDVIETSILIGVNEGLNNAAVEAVKNTKFNPAMYQGKHTDVWISFPIIFKLQKKDQN